jgi:hypothetical protein
MTASEWDDTRAWMFPPIDRKVEVGGGVASLTATVEVVALAQIVEPVARLGVIAELNRPALSVSAQEPETGCSAAILIPERLPGLFGSD